MTREDILILAKAGFNAQQIAALASVQTPAPAPAAPPVEEPKPAPAPVQKQEEQKPFDIDAILAKLDGMQAAMQRTAILQSAQPEKPEMTADSILANIINPKQEE